MHVLVSYPALIYAWGDRLQYAPRRRAQAISPGVDRDGYETMHVYRVSRTRDLVSARVYTDQSRGGACLRDKNPVQ